MSRWGIVETDIQGTLMNKSTHSLRRRASIPSGRKSLIVDTMQPWVTVKQTKTHFHFKAIDYHHHRHVLTELEGVDTSWLLAKGPTPKQIMCPMQAIFRRNLKRLIRFPHGTKTWGRFSWALFCSFLLWTEASPFVVALLLLCDHTANNITIWKQWVEKKKIKLKDMNHKNFTNLYTSQLNPANR